MNALHESLTLYSSNSSYSLCSSSSEKGETLIIDRATSSLLLLPSSTPPARFDKQIPVFGIFGIVTLLRSDYLVVITKRKLVSTILDTPVYAATDFSVFPVDRASTVELLAHPDEAYLLGLLKTHLFSAPFYFTYGGYNVTNRLQQQKLNDERSFWETCDDRFFWNRYLQSRLIDSSSAEQNLSKFILPVMFGYFETKSATINSRDLTFTLASRRNRSRAGTRYFSRGIDKEGNVSNFNETEQILLLDSPGKQNGTVKGEIRFSYVQTRGSVPVYWAEINNLRYKPDLRIMDVSGTAESLSRHFSQQVSLYGDQYLVNLVNKSGYEKPVKEAYEKALDTMGNSRVHYTYFDFHHECKGLRFDRVSVLIDSLDEELHQQGYFYQDITAPSRPAQNQTSVVRSNCMDCLDRTNVVQSALGKWVLNNQLRQIGVLGNKESVDEHPVFLHLFRNLWADNADVVSRAYSGTGALKTDYTRTGKRSKEGLLQDGVNSVVRYVKNNFLDGPRQDSYDLVTGAWIPRKGQDQAWKDERLFLTRMAPFILAAGLFMLVIGVLASEIVSEYVLTSRKLLILALILAIGAGRHILDNGIDYVSHPRLNALDEVLNYSGKGFESGRKGRPIKIVSVEAAAKRAATVVTKREAVSAKVD